MMKFLWTLTALLMAMCGAALAQSDQPSLAEIARKSKPDQKPAVVITDDDFPSASSSGGTVSSPAASPGDAQSSSAAAAKDKQQSKSGSDSQAKKTDDPAELKKKLDSYKQQRDVWAQAARDYENKLAKETSPFRRQVDEEALENDRKNVEFFQAKINQTQSQLANAQSPSSANSAGSSPDQTSEDKSPRQ